MSGPPRLTIVVPAYNEAQRIPDTLRAIARHFGPGGDGVELVVVDDGSRDDTAAVVRALAPGLGLPLRLLHYAPNAGKGFALKVGFAASRGERVLFTDADLSTPIEEADRLLAELDRGADVVIGSRRLAPERLEVRQPWLREQLGRGFTFLVRLLIAEVSDATCGFKAYRGAVGRDLFSRLRTFDWSFDAELLLLARRRGFRLAEVPVRWRDQAGSKVDLRRDVLRSLAGLVRIRARDALGLGADPLPLRIEPEVWSPSAGTIEAVAGTRP
jgi:dolichyl-phosphate beta-glucosyltransferase